MNQRHCAYLAKAWSGLRQQSVEAPDPSLAKLALATFAFGKQTHHLISAAATKQVSSRAD